MNTYRHFTIFEREKIMLWHEQGKSINYIAFQLNRHESTVSSELKGNTIIPQYSACFAQVAYHQKRIDDDIIYCYFNVFKSQNISHSP